MLPQRQLLDIIFSEYTMLMVVGGLQSSRFGTIVRTVAAEALDLENEDTNCPSLPDYPVALSDSGSSYINGVVRVCGGSDTSYDMYDSCYSFDFDDNKWVAMESMIDRRGEFGSSVIGNEWFLTGGRGTDEYGFLTDVIATEIWTESSGFVPGPELPLELWSHCQLTINDTHVFLADMTRGFSPYILDWEEKEYQELRHKLPDYTRYSPACGLLSPDGYAQSIVIAGDGTSDILSLDTMTWSTGPDLPINHERMTSVQLSDTFALVGGYNENTEMLEDSILIFDPIAYD